MNLTFDGIGGEESQVFSFEWIFIGEFGVAALGFGLSRQRRVVYLEATGLDDTNICWDTVAKFDFNDVSDADLLGLEGLLETLAYHDGILRDHVLERFHNLVTFALLVVWEDARNDHDGRQHNAQV